MIMDINIDINIHIDININIFIDISIAIFIDISIDINIHIDIHIDISIAIDTGAIGAPPPAASGGSSSTELAPLRPAGGDDEVVRIRKKDLVDCIDALGRAHKAAKSAQRSWEISKL